MPRDQLRPQDSDRPGWSSLTWRWASSFCSMDLVDAVSQKEWVRWDEGSVVLLGKCGWSADPDQLGDL